VVWFVKLRVLYTERYFAQTVFLVRIFLLQFSTLNINTRKSHKIGESRIPQINSVKGRAVDCLLKTAVDGGCYRHCALCTVCRLKGKLCCVADRQLLFGRNYGQLSHLNTFLEGTCGTISVHLPLTIGF